MIVQRKITGNPGSCGFRINSKADLPSMRNKAIDMATRKASDEMRFTQEAVKQLKKDLATQDPRLFACRLDYYFGRGSIIYTGDLFKGYDTYKGWKIREGWNASDELLEAFLYRGIYDSPVQYRLVEGEVLDKNLYQIAAAVKFPG